MNDSAHHARKPEPTPSPAETASVRADGSSSSRARPASRWPIEPTVITSSPPIPSPAASDSASRILEGRVMPGDRIGHFDLVEYVGGGGMGRVFRAIDTQLGRTVALKVLPPDQAAGADAVAAISERGPIGGPARPREHRSRVLRGRGPRPVVHRLRVRRRRERASAGRAEGPVAAWPRR